MVMDYFSGMFGKTSFTDVPISEEAVTILKNSYPNWEKIVYGAEEPKKFVEHSFEESNQLVKTDIKYVDYYLARNPHTPVNILNRIAPLVYVLKMTDAVALNPNCNIELLNKMLKQSPMSILSKIGWASEEMFEGWAKKAVLQPAYSYVLANPNMPTKMLNSYISTIETMNYRKENFLLSQNPALPVDVIEKMLTTEGIGVDPTIVIIQNPSVPARLVSKQWNIAYKNRYVYSIEALKESGRGTPEQELKSKLWVTCVDYPDKNHFMEDEDGGENPYWVTTKEEKIGFLKQYYPEVTMNMPEEWVKTLISHLPDETWLTTAEDFPNPLTKANERVMSYG